MTDLKGAPEPGSRRGVAVRKPDPKELLLTRLRDMLADIFLRSKEAMKIAHDLRLDPREVDFSQRPREFWRDVLAVARARRHFAKLHTYLTPEYRGNHELMALLAEVAETFTPANDAGGILTTGTEDAPPNPAPSQLLDARHAIVPWHDGGRTEILAQLDAWCESDGASVWLLHAEGGVGKTRLAIEWTRRLRGRGWCAGFLPRKLDERFKQRWAGDLCACGAPGVVVVIDYAETRDDLMALLACASDAARESGMPLRVLMLARNDGDWFASLGTRGDIGEWATAREPRAVEAVAKGIPSRAGVFHEAAMVFGMVRGKPSLPQTATPDLSDERFARVLYVHMAALAAVEGLPVDAGSLMDVILDHEEHFWADTAAREWGDRAFTRHLALARQMVAAATLRGGFHDPEGAEAVFERITLRARHDEDDDLIQVLHRVYERATEEAWQAPLEPDLLGEAMVIRVAEPKVNGKVIMEQRAPRDWILRVFPDDEWAPLATGFTVLGRASAGAPTVVQPWITQLLAAGGLPERSMLALLAAKVVGQRTAYSVLGSELAKALQARGDAGIAQELRMVGVPQQTVSLREVALWLERKGYESATTGESDEELAERAARANDLGFRHSEMGQRDEALKATREAVEKYRTLAARNPDAFLPDLAASLNNLGAMHREMGQRDEALKATREAVEIRRTLAARNPDAFLPDLAASLNNLGAMHREMGQRDEALKATREAVEIRRTLAARNPDTFLPDLAMSLNNLGNRHSEMGQRDEALKATREAVEIRRTLAARNPDAFLPDLAASLNNLGAMHSEMGQRDEALKATREAVEKYRTLAARNPDAFLPDLAASLNNLGAMHREMGQRDEALKATREAVEIRRTLAARNPDAFLPHLAMSLNNLGNMHSEMGQRDEALKATREAVEIRRTLAARTPDAFLPNLATSLNNLGAMHSEMGQRDEALKATREAVEKYRTLAARNPDAFLHYLAGSLNNLGNRHSEMGQRDEALKATREAVEKYRTLAARNPDAFLPDLAMSLNNLGNRHSEMGQRDEALKATREAVEKYRTLAARNPDAFLHYLAGSLNNLGAMHSEMGQRDEALKATREAVEKYRTLAARNPDAFLPDLAMSLNNLGNRHSEMGQRDEALKATREAVEIRRTLAARNPDAFLPDLAASLNNLGTRHREMGQRDEALTAAHESFSLYWRFFERLPAAFARNTTVSLRSLLTCYQSLSRQPPPEVLTRAALLSRFLQTGTPPR